MKPKEVKKKIFFFSSFCLGFNCYYLFLLQAVLECPLHAQQHYNAICRALQGAYTAHACYRVLLLVCE